MIVDSLTIVVVGLALGMLAVTVMWIVDVCTSGLERRPGSNIMGSNMPGSTKAFCMLDKVTADMGVLEVFVVVVAVALLFVVLDAGQWSDQSASHALVTGKLAVEEGTLLYLSDSREVVFAHGGRYPD